MYQKPLHPYASHDNDDWRGDVIGLLKNLTGIESITYNEEEVGEWLAGSLKRQGYTVEKQYVDKDPR